MRSDLRPNTSRQRRVPSSPIPSEAEREQALRDYKLIIEYKHLKQHAPSGVYLIPSFGNIRLFHGVIFVRRGLFASGIFKFQVRLPEKYNDVSSWPQVKFTSYVYNPFVDPNTGELYIQSAFPNWDPQKHYLVTLLTYMKQLFYIKDFDEITLPNPQARDLALKDPQSYRKKVEECVEKSLHEIYVNNDRSCTMKFGEDQFAHDILLGLLHQHERVNDPSTLTRTQILDMVKRSKRKSTTNQS